MELYKTINCKTLCASAAEGGCIHKYYFKEDDTYMCSYRNTEIPDVILQCPLVIEALSGIPDSCLICACLQVDPKDDFKVFCDIHNCNNYGGLNGTE